MGTATILGDAYQTVVMPDGKEWMAANLAWSGAGQANTNPAFGRLYTWAEAMALSTGDGWRLPTLPELRSMYSACDYTTGDFAVYAGAGALKTTTPGFWFPPNDGAADAFGLYALAGGYWFFGYAGQGYYGGFWTSTEVDAVSAYTSSHLYNSVDAGIAANTKAHSWSVRLVRDYTPIFHGFEGMDFLVAPEWGYEPKITPSLSWTKTASGLWRCLDDGAAFDAYDAEITVKVSGAVHSAWESFIAANRGTQVAYFAPAGVRPFGPHIDCTAGVQVVIGDAWSTDWRVGITADCYTLHIPMRYVGGYTPTLATMPAVVARKYPTPTWFYPTKVHATEAGTATAAPRDTETQTTQVIIDNLDQAGAAAMVNWCLYQRGASFTYTPTAGCFPFGVAAGNGPFTVRLIGWTSQKPKPNRWDMTLDFAREA